MGRFDRAARRKHAGAIHQDPPEPEVADFDALPGKQVLRAKVEYQADGDSPPVVHTQLDCNGQELVMAMAIVAVDWCRAMGKAHPDADLGVELALLMSQVQQGAATTLGGGVD